jgi:hypothetical protein
MHIFDGCTEIRKQNNPLPHMAKMVALFSQKTVRRNHDKDRIIFPLGSLLNNVPHYRRSRAWNK